MKTCAYSRCKKKFNHKGYSLIGLLNTKLRFCSKECAQDYGCEPETYIKDRRVINYTRSLK
jgi:hypothetical protein